MGNILGACFATSPPPVSVETKPNSVPILVQTKLSSPPPVSIETKPSLSAFKTFEDMPTVTITECESLQRPVSPKKGLVLSRLIGTGGFGQVHECYLDDVYCVLKTLHKRTIAAENEFNKECEILKSLNHPNIVHVVQVTRTPDGRYKELFMEHGGNTLFDLVVQGSTYLENDTICRQMISAVAYMHSLCVYHRDIKLENITIDELGAIRFVDFGLCEKKQHREEPMQTKCGSMSYAAPEIQAGFLYFGEEVDSWSLGVCLFALFFAFFPFKVSDKRDWRFEKTMVYQQITGGSKGTTSNLLSFYNKIFEHPSAKWETAIDGMICIDPNRRLLARNVTHL